MGVNTYIEGYLFRLQWDYLEIIDLKLLASKGFEALGEFAKGNF